ncbi:hypothetical protein CsSME_00018256 [Camellia sinensis var. sinensis]
MGKNKPGPRFWSCNEIFTTEVLNFVSAFGVCSGLQKYFNQQGFHIVGYGCTTCIGNSGDLDESVSSAITDNGIILFYASIHLDLKWI